jgi:hypothetical protein
MPEECEGNRDIPWLGADPEAMRELIRELYKQEGIESVGSYLSDVFTVLTANNGSPNIRHVLIVLDCGGLDVGDPKPGKVKVFTDLPTETAFRAVRAIAAASQAPNN